MTARRRARATTAQTASPWYGLGGLLFLLALVLLNRPDPRWPAAWPSLLLVAGALGVVALVLWRGFAPAAKKGRGSRLSPAARQSIAAAATVGGLALIAALLWREVAAVGDETAGALDGWVAAGDLAAAGALLLFAAALVQAALLPHAAAWNRRRLGPREINFVLLLSLAAYLLLPGGGTWLQPVGRGVAAAALDAELWLIAAAAAGATTYFGVIALKVLRRPGAAVLVFAAALFYQAIGNFVVFERTGLETYGAAVYFVAAVAAFVMDAVYMMRVYEADAPNTLWFAVIAVEVVTATIVLLMVPSLLKLPPLDANTSVQVISATILAGLCCGWCGEQLGRFAGNDRAELKS